jgi:hypothetical protein
MGVFCQAPLNESLATPLASTWPDKAKAKKAISGKQKKDAMEKGLLSI